MVTQQVKEAVTRLDEAVTAKTVRLGVTGLSRAGKTVFIASLVGNLLERGRMEGLSAALTGRIVGVQVTTLPDYKTPRFDFESHLDAMTGQEPRWPEGTRQVSGLRVSFRVKRKGFVSSRLDRERIVHLDLVDYPGEWLLDLALMNMDYGRWSAAALNQAQGRDEAAAYLELAAAAKGQDPFAEPEAAKLAKAWTGYLQAGRAAGYSDGTPGRFLLPGDLEGSPALTFAPLPEGDHPAGSLGATFADRYNAYKKKIVTPFFKDHFVKIDRQIVLIDALGALDAGPRAVEQLRRTMRDVLNAFQPERNVFLQALSGQRLTRILFTATKADHLHHTQHGKLGAIMQALVRDARQRADFTGIETGSLAIASLRTTTEETRTHEGQALDLVCGTLADTGKPCAFYAGELPERPAEVMNPALDGQAGWLEGGYRAMRFAPARLSLKFGEGPPHIRLDAAAEFLLGDVLQ